MGSKGGRGWSSSSSVGTAHGGGVAARRGLSGDRERAGGRSMRPREVRCRVAEGPLSSVQKVGGRAH